MDIRKLLEEKTIKHKFKNLHKALLEVYEGKDSSASVTQSDAELGLILLNCFPDLRESDASSDYWSYTDNIEEGSKRFKKLHELNAQGDIWTKHQPLITYLFGDRMAPFVAEVLPMFSQLMYQTSWERRSFRAPTLEATHLARQANFIVSLLEEDKYDITLEEYVVYMEHMYYYNTPFAYIWAAALNQKDTRITELLQDIVYNRHETVKVNRAIIKAMLLSNRADSWEAVVKLLLSAQRQEGLRQTILECLDETSLGALKTMIGVIVEHKLGRFSSVVRAIDVWAGFGWESERETTVRRFLELAHQYLNNLDQVPAAIKSKDNAEVYMALWAQGVHDVMECIPLLRQLLAKATIEKTALALYFISQVNIPAINVEFGLEFIQHEHLLVLSNALTLLNNAESVQLITPENKSAAFQLLESRLPEVKKTPQVFQGKVFSWLQFSISQEDVYHLMIDLIDFDDTKSIDKILPHFEKVSVTHREQITGKILADYYGWGYKEEEDKPALTQYQRDFAFKILKDRGTSIRTAALRALKNAEMGNEEIEVFEAMLKRKSADLRKSVIGIILKQKAEVVRTSVEHLLKAKNQEQRLAGLDMLVNLKNLTSEGNWVKKHATDFAQNPQITPKEQVILDTLISEQAATLTYNAENGFGLYDPQQVTPFVVPQLPTDGEYANKTSKTAFGLSQTPEKIQEALKELKQLYLKNKEYEYQYENWDNSLTTCLLGNTFHRIKAETKDMSPKEQFYNYPLADVWKKWARDHQLTSLDLYLINLTAQIQEEQEDEESLVGKKFKKTKENLAKVIFLTKIPKVGDSYWSNPIRDILQILTLVSPYEQSIDFIQGLCQAMFCTIDTIEKDQVVEEKNSWSTYYYTWRDIVRLKTVYEEYQGLTNLMDDAQFTAFWQLEKWKNDTLPASYTKTDSYISSLANYSRAYALQLISQDELMGRIMKPDAIHQLTQKITREDQYDVRKDYPFLNEMLDTARNRILEIELKRGDSSTPVTQLAQKLQQIFGIQNFIDVLVGLGKDTLHRGYIYHWQGGDYNKKEILSTLLKRCKPAQKDEQAIFDEKIKAANIKEKRLIEAVTYAPQWLPLVAKHLEWKSMESAVWWLHAHTNAHHDAETEAEIGKYSKVVVADFNDGAVDIEWFKEVYKALGKARWKMLYDSAKYISEGNGHKRAMLYADVILGNTKITEVRKRVVEKRNQDYLRVYGLVPLSKKNRDTDLLKRYQYLQKFKKESKQFGSQRQASEGLAVRIAMENLARTAGFSDPIRLTWAMETEEAKVILDNVETLTFDDVSIGLEVNEHGKSNLRISRGAKTLKSIPAKLKKEKAVVMLKEFNKTLQNQYKRTRKSLEDAMVNGDIFTLQEVNVLMTHPVVAPMLQKLVLKSEENLGFWQAGQLVTPEGKSSAPAEQLQIAHCSDLYTHKQWGTYQQYCFDKEVQQPFKQIFRELYVPTEDELGEKAVSRRYAGHQVQPQKTVALLKTRGWTVNYEEGLQKTYHKEGFIARMYAMADWFTPADVESPTLETIEFTDRKTWKKVPFEQLDPRIFSEVMRDIDLVVSVAHVGDVDPEASQSTIELRTTIVRETIRLFKLDNVALEGKHALIKGQNNEYSVHLGSAVAHKVPGVALSILPVHSQHRGRMFLPFLDEDPKTAEIMSKILLLAKDQEIQDPTILQQLN